MHVTDLLKEPACLDLIVDAAANSDYGGLITAGELAIMLPQEADDSAKILLKVVSDLAPETVIAKAYQKNGAIKIIGPSIHFTGGKPGLFGAPIPAGLSLSKTKEKRGSGDREFTAPMARISATIDDELVTLDFDFFKPADTPDYKEWCAAVVAAGKGELAPLVGGWSEPVVSAVGGDRKTLKDFPPGTYRIVALDSEERKSKGGNPYTAWIITTENGWVTWPTVMPKPMALTAVHERMLAKGKHLFMEILGVLDQTDGKGNPRIDPKTGRPYQEVSGRIYSVDPNAAPAVKPGIVEGEAEFDDAFDVPTARAGASIGEDEPDFDDIPF